MARLGSLAIDRDGRQFNLMTVHVMLWALATSLTGGFVGAYLLHLGFSLAATLLLYAALLAARFCMRLATLPMVRWIGLRRAMLLGPGIAAFQFLALVHADRLAWLCAWVLVISIGESIYWPICHAANAVTGGGGRRGRQLAFRQVAGTVVTVAGPVAGGLILSRLGPWSEFGIATAVCLMSLVPLLWLGALDLGSVPGVRRSLKVTDPVGLCAFAADGWLASGIALAWPLILFGSLGSSYDLLGWATGAGAVAGALAGLAGGHAIDRGHRRLLSRGVTVAMVIGVAMRAASAWSPGAAVAATIVGAAVAGLYYPVLMSVIYDRAKRSGSAYQFHLVTEVGWDIGAILGCAACAAVAWSGAPSTLAVLPAALGVLVVHRCVRAEARGGAGTKEAAPVLA
jgi:MFS transporter, DHA1 family, inner membrane transport protein